ncbi:hypothetical protein [Fundidesulfovibrio terrae]|uniref:hypothetical protein n=1 Tax=Fundidesulfovibrio terrae TaxID=2922866 RepID=UPI001FB0275E|nr:hypothetical protein [Fundidesulfovibrio terrae]
MSHLVLMLHPMLGMLAILAAGWAFVETRHTEAANEQRIRTLSNATAVLVWISYLVAGYWYVVYYAPDKAVILKGPWKFSHSYFMETKEHVFFVLLLLATFLPIVARDDIKGKTPARTLVGWVAGLVMLLGIMMEGYGAFISMGVKLGALPH